MGARSRRKGTRIERELVALHRAAGIEARRVPLSGSLGGELAGDVRVTLPGLGELRAEVKARGGGEGFRTLERWLGGFDALFLRRDGAAPLVLLPWSVYARLVTNTEGRVGGDA